MKPQSRAVRLLAALALSTCSIAILSSAPARAADAKFVITPVIERKVNLLPAGPLYWRLETFPTLAKARLAEGPTSLSAEVEGMDWLFTLGPKGGSTPGGTKIVEVGPIAEIIAPEYLLRINNAVAPSGTKTGVHMHAGSEAFYVLTGRLSQKTDKGVANVEAGQTMPGRGPGTTMEVSSTGTTDLHALVLFVVDTSQPFSTPSKFK